MPWDRLRPGSAIRSWYTPPARGDQARRGGFRFAGPLFCGVLFRPTRRQHFHTGVLPPSVARELFLTYAIPKRLLVSSRRVPHKNTQNTYSSYLTHIHATNFKVNLLHNPSVQNARKTIQRPGRSMTLQTASDLQLSPSGQSRSRSFSVCLNRPLLESEVIGISELHSTPYERQSLV